MACLSKSLDVFATNCDYCHKIMLAHLVQIVESPQWLSGPKDTQIYPRVNLKPRGLRPLRFLASGLALDAASGFAFGKSLGRLQINPRVSLSTRGTTRGEIFPDNHWGLSTVFQTLVEMQQTRQVLVHVTSLWARASRRQGAERSRQEAALLRIWTNTIMYIWRNITALSPNSNSLKFRFCWVYPKVCQKNNMSQLSNTLQ